MNVASKIEAAARICRVDLTVDPDEVVIAVAAATGLQHYSELARALNVVMEVDAAAAARYLEIYGRPFEPIPPFAGDDDDEDAPPRFAAGTGSESITVVGW